jgi:hypothetical protein
MRPIVGINGIGGLCCDLGRICDSNRIYDVFVQFDPYHGPHQYVCKEPVEQAAQSLTTPRHSAIYKSETCRYQKGLDVWIGATLAHDYRKVPQRRPNCRYQKSFYYPFNQGNRPAHFCPLTPHLPNLLTIQDFADPWFSYDEHPVNIRCVEF